MPRTMVLLPLIAAVGAAGCASTSFSQLDGRRYHITALDTYPVAVVKVDDSSTPFRNPVQVEPGVHRVTVQAPPGGAGGISEERTVTLQVAPCTRYYLVAVKEGRLSKDFTVKVDHEEQVAGCRPPRG